MAVFVFGSNRRGRHGRGAALHAVEMWGAEEGVGEGPTGRSYALPTKDEHLRPLPLAQIERSIQRFVDHAGDHPNILFLLTPVGTGYAGYTRREIAEIIRRVGLPDNVMLTHSWITDIPADGRRSA